MIIVKKRSPKNFGIKTNPPQESSSNGSTATPCPRTFDRGGPLGWLTVSDETKKPPKTLETSPKTSEQIKRFQGSSKLTKQTSEAG